MATLRSLREAFRAAPFPDRQERTRALDRLLTLILERRDAIADAISDDFGHRSRHESLVSEVYVTAAGIRYIKKHLRAWMAPEPRPVTLALQPARARIVPQPLGVIGIISPWNYPIQLALLPLAYALAAGNRVMLKPSELTPGTSELMRTLLADAFHPDHVAVITGGPEVGAAFSELPFDHLFYTGSTRVGRLVMQAAAKNLTPVTLELGGKSPAWIHPDYPTEKAAASIAMGKLFNAGQTCVAPDYVLVRRDQADALERALVASIEEMYPGLVDNPDYTSIINDQHRERLQGYLADAEAHGARLVTINPASESFEASTKLAPVLIRDPTEEMAVMQEEIFGPLLPIVAVDSVDAAAAYINDHPRPLAMYVFDRDKARVEGLLRHTHAGGVSVNDTMLHVAEEHLPFGGVGPSGMGAYHGREGFDTFSHRKAVLHQPRLNSRFLLAPPYGRTIERLLDLLI
ncbi:MAG TPA: coniferyl aldehyde dehydrogenase [Deltaproteobacteria bacterium]|nr:coniferyl aldehyde dehydrogenase [Deltaproteobacteria bacterium]